MEVFIIRMVIIKKLGILSVAKVQALIMAIFGLFLGIFYAILFGLIGVANQTSEGVMSGGIVAGLGIMAVVAAPIF